MARPAALGVLLAAASCGTMGKAFEERVQGRAAVQLACSRAHSIGPLPAGSPQLRLRVTPMREPVLLGRLFGQAADGPVVVVTNAPAEVLDADARAVLEAAGLGAGGGDAAPEVRLTLRHLEARQVGGRWWELRGTTSARVQLRVEVSDGPTARAWTLDGAGQTRMAYATAKDMEDALTLAYCEVLRKLDEVARSPELRAAVTPARPTTARSMMDDPP